MNNNIFEYNFPNNLKIARRKVKNDKTIAKIYSNIEKIENSKNTPNKYLSKFLNNSFKMGKMS